MKQHLNLKIVGLFVSILLCALQVNAGIIRYSNRLSNATLGIQQNEILEVSSPNNVGSFFNKKVHKRVTLGFDQYHSFYSATPFQVKVVLEIQRYKHDLTSVISTDYETFNITYGSSSNSNLIDRSTYDLDENDNNPLNYSADVDNKTYKIKIKVFSILVEGLAGYTNSLPPNVYIDADIFIERYYEFYQGTTPINFSMTGNEINTILPNTQNEYPIKWEAIVGAEEYQLEWIYVNDFSASGLNQSKNINALTFDFNQNSTRISTTQTEYKLPLTYERGYIVYRVRALGIDFSDLNDLRVINGVWNCSDIGIIGSLSTDQYLHISSLKQHEIKLNWQSETTYAEDGKRKDVVNYFDGSLRSRQTATKINSDNTVVAGETIYDHQGRPVINVLPTPIQATALNYTEYLNQNMQGLVYSKNDFDINVDECTVPTTGMNTTSGSSKYYSPSNPDQGGIQSYVPDANNFPFSKVQHTPDNTGRIKKQGGVGPDFQIESGHETKYVYGQPNQLELDRMFGSEVGNALHYKKNTVIDAHQQSSISYLDMEGRVIATSLAGDKPTNLNGLADESTSEVLLHVNAFGDDNKLNKITVEGNGIAFESQLSVSYKSIYTFDYSFDVPPFQDPCLGEEFCIDCVYDLDIKLYNDCGKNIFLDALGFENKVVGKFSQNANGVYQFHGVCTAPSNGSENIAGIALELEPGEYNLEKHLTIREDAIDSYIDYYIANASSNEDCFLSLLEFQEGALSEINTEDCNLTCESCLNDLGNLDEFIANGLGTEEDYDLQKRECELLCDESLSYCETAKIQMLADMMPGGQYGGFETNSDGNISFSNYPLSVYNSCNVLPKKSCDPNGAFYWKNPQLVNSLGSFQEFREENGTRSTVAINIILDADGHLQAYRPDITDASLLFTDENGSTYTYPENLVYVEDFIAFFKPSWAQSLLIYHPEYEYYKACILFDEKYRESDRFSSLEFDRELNKVFSFEAAKAKGFLKANGNDYNNISHWGNLATNNQIPDPSSSNDIFPWDPALVYFSPQYITQPVGCLSVSSSLIQKITHFKTVTINDEEVELSMMQAAALLARCGEEFGVVAGVDCYAFGSPTDPEVLDKEWNYFKSFYLSAKGELQRAFYECAANISGDLNVCIGNDSFDPIEEGIEIPLVLNIGLPNALQIALQQFVGSPYYNECFTCNYLNASLYETKIARFGGMRNLPAQSLNEIETQVYQATGQCPMTRGIQSVLSRLASEGKLDATNYSLNNYSELASIFVALNNLETPGPIPNLQYQFTYHNGNPNALEIHFINTDEDPDATFTSIILRKPEYLNINGQMIQLTWDQVIEMLNLQAVDENGNFTAIGAFMYQFSIPVDDGNGGTINQEQEVKQSFTLTGSVTGLNIFDCGFEQVCTPNQLAVDLSIAMNGMALMQSLNQTGANLTSIGDSENSIDVSTEIMETAAAVGPNLYGQYDATQNKLTFFNSSVGSNQGLVVEYISVEPAPYTLADIPSILSFQTMMPNGFNSFTQTASLSGGVQLTLTGALYRKDENGNLIRVKVGECDYPLPLACQEDPYVIYEDLKRFTEELLVEKDFNAPNFDVETCINFSGKLAEQFPNGASTNFNYIPTESNFINDLKITAGDCFIQYISQGDLVPAALNLQNITEVKNFVLLEEPTNIPVDHQFYFTATFSQNGNLYTDYVYGNTACLQLKDCFFCDAIDDGGGGVGSSFCQNIEGTIPSTPCETAYQTYLDAISNYNNWASTNGGYSFNQTKTYEVFTDENLCHCVGQFEDILIGIQTGLTTVGTQEQLGQITSFSSFCSMPNQTCQEIPWESIPPNTTTVTVVDNCVLMQQYQAIMSASNSYNIYLDNLKTQLRQNYLDHCLKPTERLKYTYNDKAYQYTLYYYDQAGNLIKTVPPEGVEIMGFTDSDSPTSLQIIADRRDGTKKVFTKHRMQTRYEYNSLNQLTGQFTPDTDPMEIFELSLPNGLLPQLQTTQIQMLNQQQGYLTGYIGLPNANGAASITNRIGLLYRTDDGGSTWKKINNLIGTDLNKINFVTDQIGFAVGNDGIVLRTLDAGLLWNQVNTWDVGSTTNGFIRDISDFKIVKKYANYYGVFVGKNGMLANFSTTDLSSLNFSINNISLPSDLNYSISAITADDDNFYITLNFPISTDYPNGRSAIYSRQIMDHNGSWSPFTTMSVNDLSDIQFVEGTKAYAVGKDGRMYMNSDAGNTSSNAPLWVIQPTTINYPIHAIRFFNANNGVALMEFSAGQLYLMRTADAGLNWKQVSEFTFNGLCQSSDQTLIMAYGPQGRMEIVVDMEDLPYENIVVNYPMNSINITAAWMQKIVPTTVGSFNEVRLAIGFEQDGVSKLSYTKNAFNFTPVWLNEAYIPSLDAGVTIQKIEANYFETGTTKNVIGVYQTSDKKINGFKIAVNPSSQQELLITTGLTLNNIPADGLYQTLSAYVSSQNRIYCINEFNGSLDYITLNSTATTSLNYFQSGITLSSLSLDKTKQLDYFNGSIIAISSDGKVEAISLANNTTLSHTDKFRVTQLLDIFCGNDFSLFATGDNGVLMHKSSTMNDWKLVSTGVKNDVHAFTQVGTNYFIAGSKGLLRSGQFTSVSDESTFVNTMVQTVANRSNEEQYENYDLLDLVNDGARIYGAGTNGFVIYCENYGSSPLFKGRVLADKRYPGICIKPDNTVTTQVETTAMLVGENATMYELTGLNAIQQVNLNVFALQDVHFSDIQTGTVMGEHFTLRTTTDGGVNWKIVVPSDNTDQVLQTAPTVDFKRVWTQGNMAAHAFGSSTYLIQNGLAKNITLLPGTITAVNQGKTNAYLHLAVENNGSNAVYQADLQTDFTFSSSLLIGGISRKINALHIFNNNSFMIAGENSLCAYFNSNDNSLTAYTFSSPSLTFNDVIFTDNVYGILVGDDGEYYKTNNISTTVDDFGYLQTIVWDKKEDVFNYDPYAFIQTGVICPSLKPDLKAVAFSKPTHPLLGGAYDEAIYADAQTYLNLQYPATRKLYDPNARFSSRFYYDRLGRLVLSQNSRQYNNRVDASSNDTPIISCDGSPQLKKRKYSYTLYDALGRVVEVGEKTQNTQAIDYDPTDSQGPELVQFNDVFGAYVADYYNPNVIDDAKLLKFIKGDGARKEVTKSYYDKQHLDLTSIANNFTVDEAKARKRIVHVSYEEVFDNNDATYDHATHYNYDIHGNVKTLIQDNKKMAENYPSTLAPQSAKRLDYSYDLVSGNVHRVSFQTGEKDQWHHAYQYDADNRITQVYTNTHLPFVSNSLFAGAYVNELSFNSDWENDANYFYYKHGPLARVELGEQHVQGLDYVYNLQGWLKGVNSTSLDKNRDPGMDGVSATFNAFFAKDAAGFGLDYFAGDYSPINSNKTGLNAFQASIVGSEADLNSNNLYNGNIRSMQTTITNPTTGEVLPMANAYRYDQLNRINESKSFTAIDFANNTWGNESYNNQYYNAFTFDRNGNILSQKRHNAQGQTLEDMVYQYHTQDGRMLKNRLYHVNDNVSANVADDDIDDQGVFTPHNSSTLQNINELNNYRYDEEGRLVKDLAENIENIEWRVDGKIKSIIRESEENIHKEVRFDYDAMGHRIAKHVLNPQTQMPEKSSYYFLDAQGNTMNVYEHEHDALNSTSTFKLEERHIFGSSRLGMKAESVDLLATTTSNPVLTHALGLKRYELSNHLGNVLSVISDRKFPQSTDNTTVSGYLADIKLSTDYSPYGVILDGRNFKQQICEDVTTTQTLTDYTNTFDGVCSTEGFVSANSLVESTDGTLTLSPNGTSLVDASIGLTLPTEALETSISFDLTKLGYTGGVEASLINSSNASVGTFSANSGANTWNIPCSLPSGSFTLRFASSSTLTSTELLKLDNVVFNYKAPNGVSTKLNATFNTLLGDNAFTNGTNTLNLVAAGVMTVSKAGVGNTKMSVYKSFTGICASATISLTYSESNAFNTDVNCYINNQFAGLMTSNNNYSFTTNFNLVDGANTIKFESVANINGVAAGKTFSLDNVVITQSEAGATQNLFTHGFTCDVANVTALNGSTTLGYQNNSIKVAKIDNTNSIIGANINFDVTQTGTNFKLQLSFVNNNLDVSTLVKVDGNTIYTLSASELVQNVVLYDLSIGVHSLSFETQNTVTGSLSDNKYFTVDDVIIWHEISNVTQNCIDYEDTKYRYSAFGYEKDDEIKGEGNSYTTEFRQYDSRIGRWYTLDPLVKPNESPYASFSNSPLFLVDKNGADTSNIMNEAKKANFKVPLKELLANSPTFKTFFSKFTDDKAVYKEIMLEFKAVNDLKDPKGGSAAGITGLMYKNELVTEKTVIPDNAKLSDFKVMIYLDETTDFKYEALTSYKTVTMTHEMLIHVESISNMLYSKIYKNDKGVSLVKGNELKNTLVPYFNADTDHNNLYSGKCTLYNSSANEMLKWAKESNRKSSNIPQVPEVYGRNPNDYKPLNYFELLNLDFKLDRDPLHRK